MNDSIVFYITIMADDCHDFCTVNWIECVLDCVIRTKSESVFDEWKLNRPSV